MDNGVFPVEEIETMNNHNIQQSVKDLLKDFRGEHPFRELCSELNYDYTNELISTRNWSESASSIFIDNPVIFASAGVNNEFHIIYTRLKDEKRLLLGHERQVISQLLKDYPYSLIVFSNSDHNLWHFVNVKLVKGKDDETNKDKKVRRLFRRITVGHDERLRTAVDRTIEKMYTVLDIGKFIHFKKVIA